MLIPVDLQILMDPNNRSLNFAPPPSPSFHQITRSPCSLGTGDANSLHGYVITKLLRGSVSFSAVVHGGGTFMFFDLLYRPSCWWRWWLQIWVKPPLPSRWWWIDVVFEKCDLRSFLIRISRLPRLMTCLSFVWLLLCCSSCFVPWF
jgi:hypothetical protein